MKERIGVIGLGLMGTAIAERLLAAGFQAVVYNRTPEKAQPVLDLGGEWSDNPLQTCERVLISLYTTEIVEQVLQRFAPALRPGLLLIDTTTGDSVRTVELGHRLRDHGVRYLEAPVSGSSEQTRRGEVTTIVGGPIPDFSASEDLLRTFSKELYHVGPWGSAANMKLVSNLILGLNRAALAEGLALASSMGLDLSMALSVLTNSAAYSRVMDAKGRKMIDREFTPQAKLSQHLKDVRLILDAGKRGQARLPFSELHQQLLESLESAGCGDLDNSAIIHAFLPDRVHAPS